MRLIIISDTHGAHEQLTLPEGDVLIHCGDMINQGSLLRFNHFAAWMRAQKFDHKLIIYGNHALGFSRDPKKSDAAETCRQFGLTLLEESDVVINGVKFWGSSATPYFYDWEFNYQRGEDIAKIWSKIPDDTNVLITHGPPYGVLDLVDDTYLQEDLHQGCEELKKKVDALPNLKVHVFGHLHKQGGEKLEQNEKIFTNAAMVNDNYKIVREPIVIDI
jgi:Icc-related predicted phosphoesterase